MITSDPHPTAAILSPRVGGGGLPVSRQMVRLFGLALGLGALYALGALLPWWFLKDTSTSGSAFFPPAGLTLAALALTPRRTWPLWLSAAAIAELSVDLTHNISVVMALGFALANTAEPFVGAVTMRAATRRSSRSMRSALVCYLACAVVLGPFVGALIGSTVGVIFGSGGSWFTVMTNWWLGDALGVLVVATPILAWSRPSRYEPQAHPLEIALMSVITVALTVIAGVLWHRPLIYLVLPLLLWAALRGGIRAVSAVAFFVAFATDWVAVTGHADRLLSAIDTSAHLAFIQLFLATTFLAAMILCIEVAHRRQAEAVLRRAEADRIRAELAVATATGNERHRIARETHDIVGHTLNVMLLQAGAARRFLGSDTERSRDLLESLEATGRDAFRDLDMVLGLSDRSDDLQPERGLDAVPDLVGKMRDAGQSIELAIARPGNGVGRPPTLVDWSVYRILQEALTNAAKHAPGAPVRVEIRHEADAVFLHVVNDCTPADGARVVNGDRHGRGLLGMQERVTILGGQMDVRRHDGEFALRVRLPIQAGRS